MTRWICISLLTAICSAQQAAQAPKERSSVRLAITTTHGGPVGKCSVVLREIGPTAEYRRVGEESVRFDAIPFGLYDLEIYASGFATRRERLGIYQPELTLKLGLHVSQVEQVERPEIIGLVVPPPGPSRDLWVRLVPMYSGDFLEDRVKPNGSFHVGNVHEGRYVILVIDQENIVLSKMVDHLGGRLKINLAVPK